MKHRRKMSTYDDQLLAAVSRYPVIYNHMRSDYKNSDAKAKAWDSVAKSLHTDEPVEKIRQRWKSIRDSYVKYLNKIDRTTAGQKIKPYKFERELQFLKPFLNIQRDAQMKSDLEDIQIDSAGDLLAVTQYEDDQSSNSSISSKKMKRSNETCSSSVLIENSITQLNQTYRTFQQMDDLDCFFLGLSQTMKKLRPLTIAKLKKEMANLVTDAEIRELEEMDLQYVNGPEGY